MKIFSSKILFFIFLTPLCVAFLFFDSSRVFASTDITEDIQANTTWTAEGSPYIIKNNIAVVLGVTLTIDPGVVIKFDPTAHASVTILGDLIANGELNNKIYFTSNYDDTVGGDTDGDYFCYEDFDEEGNSIGEVCDGSWLVPSQNDWGGIIFFDSHNNSLKNVVFKYANEVAYFDHTYLNLKNIEISNSRDGLTAYVSNVDADGVDCVDLSGSCLIAYKNSNINWINSILDNLLNNGMVIFNSSSLNISNTLLKNLGYFNDNWIDVFNDSSILADNINFLSPKGESSNFITVSNNSKLILNNSEMKNCLSQSCLEVFDLASYSKKPSSFSIKNSSFLSGANDGINVFGYSTINGEIHNSKIIGFSNFAINTESSHWAVSKNINAEDNFWGNNTGPFHPDKNPTGTAGIVDNGIEFVPFCLTEQCKSRDPVILVPGIMGTELFKYYDDQKEIWPNVDKLIFSITDNFLNDLALNTDGTENRDMPMKLGDIIRGTHLDILGKKYDSKTFEGLISELEKSGYIENANLFVFPYDWRKSNVVSAEKLKEKINKILLDTGADKVDLVAHSMGGLVVKKYIADNGADNVDQIIFIGTPQLGAPKAFKVIIEGDDMGVRIGKLSLLSLDKVKYISQNMPGVFELLPSKKYIDGQSDFSGNKYITDYITPSFSDSKNSIKPDLSFIQTEDFLKSQKINTKMLGFADNLHTDTDNLDLSNIKVSNFIGCGATKTIGHITVKKKTSGILFWKKLVNTYDLQYENGDDTVPLRSADNSFGKKYYVKGSSHGELPSASGLRELVTATLRGKKLIDFTNVSNDKHDCFIKGKSITLYSMLPMMEYLVYDEYDNFTGPVKSIDLKLIQDPTETEKSSEEIEYGIPGVQYNKIGGTTSIFLPAGGSYKIVVKNIPVSSGGGGGSAGGSIINSYDLSIGNINADDTSAGSVNFNNVRVNNPDESFQIEIPADTFPDEVNAGIPPVIQVDENGDGIYEEEIPPTVVLTDTQANDTSVPNTTGTISGNTVSLSASDENSGISNTQYSLDGGNTWTNYTVPIEINVVPGGSDITIQYFSTDNAGNIEPIQTITITAPPLPVPVIINNTRHSSGGIILLNLNNNLQDKNVLNVEQKVINKEKPKIDFSISDFKRTVLKEAQEPSLSKLNVNSKSIVFKDTQVHSSESSGKNLSKERQLASAVNSNQKIKPIWFFVIVVILSGVILIVRNYKKR